MVTVEYSWFLSVCLKKSLTGSHISIKSNFLPVFFHDFENYKEIEAKLDLAIKWSVE